MAIYILIALQVLDAITTVVALRNPKLTESNPILKPLFDKFGALQTLVVAKLGFIGLLYWFAQQVHQDVLYILIVAYVYIVANNTRLILTTR